MPTEAHLENYLQSLDRSLSQIPVSDRADIVIEIKSHALAAQGKEPDRKMSDILAALGEPESVANRYLVERGLKPGKASKSPMIKWLTIGFLGTFGMILLMVVLFVWRFTPLIEVDEKTNRVALLGGMLQVNGEAGDVKFGDLAFLGKGAMSEFESSASIPAGLGVHFEFSNGKLEFTQSNAVERTVRYECKVHSREGQSARVEPRIEAKHLTLDFGHLSGAECEVTLPKGVPLAVKGGNGKIDFERLENPISVDVINGVVSIDPVQGAEYTYVLSLTNGKIGEFQSSTRAGAIPVKVKLVNGKIDRAD